MAPSHSHWASFPLPPLAWASAVPHVLVLQWLSSVILGKRLVIPVPLGGPLPKQTSLGPQGIMDFRGSRHLLKLSPKEYMCMHTCIFLGRGPMDFPSFLQRSLIPKGLNLCPGLELPST